MANPVSIGLQRLLPAQAAQFPELSQLAYDNGLGPTVEFLIDVLKKHVKQGDIALDDLYLGATTFLSMSVGGLVRTLVSGMTLTPHDTTKRLEFSVDLFLNGLGYRKGSAFAHARSEQRSPDLHKSDTFSLSQSPSPADIGPLIELLGVRLREVGSLLNLALTSEMTGLNRGCLVSMALIFGNPAISQKDLAKKAGFDKSNIVAIINNLESRGFAVRSVSPQDRRRHELYLTPEGISALQGVVDKAKSYEDRMLYGLDIADRERLDELLKAARQQCWTNLK